MRIVKGDKVKYLDLEGVAISNPYMYISDMDSACTFKPITHSSIDKNLVWIHTHPDT